MLKLVLGCAGSGKTQYIENKLIKCVKEGAVGQILIVPEQFSFSCERKLLSALPASLARNIEVLSFTRMADRFIEDCGCQKSFLDKGRQAVAMSMALDGAEDSLEIFSGKSGDLDFVNALSAFSSEMKRGCVPPQSLRSAGIGGTLGKKLNEISLVLETYEAVIQNTFFDAADKLGMFCSYAGKTGYFKGKTVVIDSFKGFTEQEFKIIELIMSQAEDLTVTLCCEGLQGESEPFSLFYCVDRTLKRLMLAAKKSNVRVEPPVVLKEAPRFKNGELSLLQKGIFRQDAAVWEGECKNVFLYRASDIYSECDLVARKIKSLLRDENFRARDIAVVYRDDSYAPIIQSALKRRDVPVFYDARQPFSVQPLLVFVKHAFSAVMHGFRSEDIFKYLKSGLAGLDTEAISELENYVYVWQISGKKWKDEWTQNPRGFEKPTDADICLLEKINKLRKNVAEPLEDFAEKCKNASARQISAAVFLLLKRIGAAENLKIVTSRLEKNGEYALADEQNETWNFVMRVLDDMVGMLGEKQISLQKYEKLFWFIVNCSDLGRIPSGLDEVELGNADRIRTSEPRAVFVVGLNDGKFPKVPSQGGILSSSDLKTLENCGLNICDDAEYVLSQERFLVYSSLCCASESVFASYSENEPSGEKTAPSIAVLQLRKLFPGLKAADRGSEDELYFADSEQSAFELLAEKWNDNDSLTASLKKYFSEKPQYASKIKALQRIGEGRGFSFENSENATALFGRNMYVSASRVDKFHECRFKYFCRYGMNVQKRSIAQLDYMKSGLIVHYVMENILRKYGKEKLISATSSELDRSIEEIMWEYLSEFMGGKDDKDERFIYLFKRLKVIISSVVRHTVAEFAQSDFNFVDFELKIDRDGDIMPLTLLLSDGGTVSVHGSVDRVDLMEKDGVSYIRVVDYKTGTKKFKLSDVLSGLNMQMLIYLDCICKNGAERYGKTLPAGVMYVLSRREYAKGREINDENTPKSEGIVLDDMDILLGMEKGLSGKYIPAKLGKEKLAGDIISAHHMGLLLNRVEKVLCEMATALHGGDIDTSPILDSNGSSICLKCDYLGVCLEDSETARNVPSFKNEEVFEILDSEECDND